MSLENDNTNSAPESMGAVDEASLAGELGAVFDDSETGDGHADHEKPAKKQAKQSQPEDGEEDADGDEPEADGEPDAEESQDENEEPSEDGEKPTTIKFKDGTEVTLDEIEKSYFREKDYRQKTAEVAEERKAITQAGEAIKKAEAEAKEATKMALAILQHFIPPEPDVTKSQTDPIGYLQEKAQYDASVKLLNEVVEKNKTIGSGEEAVNAIQTRERINAEFKALGEKAPELKSQDAYRKFIEKAAPEAQKHYGFDPAEVMALADHRAVLVIKDALAYRAAQSKAAKSTEGHAAKNGNPAKTVLMPGKPSAKSAQITFAKQTNSAVARARQGDEAALAELIGATFSR